MKCHFLILCVFVKAIAGHISSGWSPSYVQSGGQSYNLIQPSYQQNIQPNYQQAIQPSYLQNIQPSYQPNIQHSYQQNIIPSYHQNIQSVPIVPVVPVIPVHEQNSESYDHRQNIQSALHVNTIQSAQHIQSSPLQYHGYNGITTQNFVPQDTPEVQAAKAQHFAAYARALALVSKDGQGIGQQQYIQGNEYYNGQTQGIQSASLNGYVPVDTPEVQQAKAAHLEAHARARAHLSAWSQPSNQWAQQGYYHQQQPGPVDTPEVQAARAQHLLAHQKARSGNFGIGDQSFGIGSSHGQDYNSATPQHPVDTPEVQAAKAQHFAAYEAELEKHRRLAASRTSFGRKETPHY